jgi:UDP-N-acetyl-D-glucosamine dehydrogenase
MKAAREADVVVIITNHKDYEYPALLKQAQLIVDPRNAYGAIAKGDAKVIGL